MITVFITAVPLVTIMRYKNPVHVTHYFFRNQFPTYAGPQNDLVPSCFLTKVVYIFIISHVLCATSSGRLIPLNFLVKFQKFINYKHSYYAIFLHLSIAFSLLLEYSPQSPFLRYSIICSFFRVRLQLSEPDTP
jgi:hypothetical protein